MANDLKEQMDTWRAENLPTNSIGKNGKTYPEERKSMVERMVNIKFPHKTISGKQNYMTLTEEEAINLYSDLKGTLGGLV